MHVYRLSQSSINLVRNRETSKATIFLNFNVVSVENRDLIKVWKRRSTFPMEYVVIPAKLVVYLWFLENGTCCSLLPGILSLPDSARWWRYERVAKYFSSIRSGKQSKLPLSLVMGLLLMENQNSSSFLTLICMLILKWNAKNRNFWHTIISLKTMVSFDVKSETSSWRLSFCVPRKKKILHLSLR